MISMNIKMTTLNQLLFHTSGTEFALLSPLLPRSPWFKGSGLRRKENWEIDVRRGWISTNWKLNDGEGEHYEMCECWRTWWEKWEIKADRRINMVNCKDCAYDSTTLTMAKIPLLLESNDVHLKLYRFYYFICSNSLYLLIFFFCFTVGNKPWYNEFIISFLGYTILKFFFKKH